MGVLRQLLPQSGDTAVTWGDTQLDDVKNASEAEVKEKFDSIIKAGHSVFEITGTGAQSAKVFDETAEEYVVVPTIMGG